MVKKANPKAVAKAVQAAEVAANGTVELSLQDMVEMRPALAYLMQIKLPARSSFRLAQLCNVLNPHLTAFQQVRDNLIREMGEQQEGSKEYQVTEAKMPEFTAQMEAMGAEMVSIPLIKVVLPASLEIEGQYLMVVERFVEVADA